MKANESDDGNEQRKKNQNQARMDASGQNMPQMTATKIARLGYYQIQSRYSFRYWSLPGTTVSSESEGTLAVTQAFLYSETIHALVQIGTDW